MLPDLSVYNVFLRNQVWGTSNDGNMACKFFAFRHNSWSNTGINVNSIFLLLCKQYRLTLWPILKNVFSLIEKRMRYVCNVLGKPRVVRSISFNLNHEKVPYSRWAIFVIRNFFGTVTRNNDLTDDLMYLTGHTVLNGSFSIVLISGLRIT